MTYPSIQSQRTMRWVNYNRECMPVVPKPNKNEIRTKETRELLLKAAETIFVRDGYEGAELGEIAAIAGRTKGAIYNHFASKEDIFLALFEERSNAFRAQMEENLGRSSGREQTIAIFRDFCLSMLQNRTFGMLLLEFKLFAIRHPAALERFQKHYQDFLPPNQEKRLVQFLGPAGRSRTSVSRTAAVQTMQPLFSALALEATFAPTVLDDTTMRNIAARVFDALIQQ